MNSHFQEDCIQILAERARRGEISRRRFTQLAVAMMGAAAVAARGTPVLADTGELVFVNWGGDASLRENFARSTGRLPGE